MDHVSTFIHNHIIEGTISAETLAAKNGYERVANAYVVKIKAYHADNLRFNDAKYEASCIKVAQRLSVCGVETHYQNNIVEHMITEICYGGRTSLLHAKIK